MSGLGKGLSSFGHTVKDKSTSFGHTVVDKGSSIGHNVKDRSLSLGYSIKDHAYRRKNYSVDDELLDHVYHDLKQSIKALKYISAQQKRFSKRYWPWVFKSMTRTTKGFIDLAGEHSLEFDGIEEYYDAFDKIQESLELFAMHPTERQRTISSINFALTNFLITVNHIRDRVVQDSEELTELVQLKNDEMRLQLKYLTRSLKMRTKRKIQYLDLHRKTEKLMKKNTPLLEKEELELKSLETKTQGAKEIYENINSRLKLILPENIALLEEYIELITKLIISSQTQAYEFIESEIHDYVRFHGFVSQPSEPLESSLNYTEIIDTWEALVTPTKIRIESFVSSIHDKNPENVGDEIESKDKSSRMQKALLLVTHKVTDKLHNVKPKDHVHGIFSEDLTADPLRSFLKYQSSELNQAENYHPQRTLALSEVYVAKRDKKTPPALPPRDDFHPINLSPHVGQISSPIRGQGSDMNDSNDSPDSDSDLSLSTDKSDDDESILSTDALTVDLTPDSSVKKLKKIYNESKNDIKAVPLTYTEWPDFKLHKDVFDKTNSIAYKLIELNKFFETALDRTKDGDNQAADERVALDDFKGEEPGDLSFKEGDVIDVILDLQKVNVSYLEKDENWFIGATNDSEHRRVGFAPSSLLSKN